MWGVDIEQIERVYDRNLPLSKEMARSLQAFWGWANDIFVKETFFGRR